MGGIGRTAEEGTAALEYGTVLGILTPQANTTVEPEMQALLDAAREAGPPVISSNLCLAWLLERSADGAQPLERWLAADAPLTMGIWAMGGLEIGHGGFMQFNRPHVYGWRCAHCCKIIVDERA